MCRKCTPSGKPDADAKNPRRTVSAFFGSRSAFTQMVFDTLRELDAVDTSALRNMRQSPEKEG